MEGTNNLPHLSIVNIPTGKSLICRVLLSDVVLLRLLALVLADIWKERVCANLVEVWSVGQIMTNNQEGSNTSTFDIKRGVTIPSY